MHINLLFQKHQTQVVILQYYYKKPCKYERATSSLKKGNVGTNQIRTFNQSVIAIRFIPQGLPVYK